MPASRCASTATAAWWPRTRSTPRARGQFESWSLAKSVTALVFGRAMTQELISRHDRIGGLITEADSPHGAVSLEQLLT